MTLSVEDYPKMRRQGWTRDELLLAFNLYCRTPFGRLHRNNRDIIELASVLGRTPSAVAMKLVNFASLDPVHQRRKVRGLRNASRSDHEILQEFLSNWEQLAFESEQALGRIASTSPRILNGRLEPDIPSGPTDEERVVRVRIVQRFFRDVVLASYENRRAICTIAVPELLNASHIIPWSNNMARRADPTNGLALCSLHDRAFDRGLLTIDADFRVVIASSLKIDEPPTVHRVALSAIEGKAIELPRRFYPDPEALRFHRENVFHNRL